jgi:hypothetical protein
MMNKIIIVFALSLVLMGCGYEPPVEIPNFKLGYEGVNLRFSIFPEGDIYENDKFIVQMEAWNRGGYDTNNAYFVLNYDQGFFFTDKSTFFPLTKKPLHGRSLAYPEGEFQTTDLIDLTSKEVFLTEFQSFDFIGKFCYEYKTEATLAACIGPKKGYMSCNFEELNTELNLTKGQGSPLAITGVEQTIVDLGDTIRPRFNITIENKKSGQVFRNPDVNVQAICKGSGIGIKVLERFDMKINLSKDYRYDSTKKPEDNSLTCAPTVPRLEKGKASIICTLREEIPTGPAFVAPLFIQLEYGYTDNIQERLTVRKFI